MSVRTRRTRRTRLASFAAVVVLGATVPVLGGASAAWACGDVPEDAAATVAAAAPAATVAAAAPAATVAAAAPSDVPSDAPAQVPVDKLRVEITAQQKSLEAGGDPVEFQVRIANSGTVPAEGIAPFVAFFDEAEAADRPGSILTKEDLILQVKTSDGWRTLSLRPGCDPVLRSDDYASLKSTVPAGGSATFTFRLAVTGHSNPDQTQVDVYGGVLNAALAPGADAHLVLPIRHAAPTDPNPPAGTTAPTAAPSTSAPASAPAKGSTPPAVVPAAAISPAATTPAPSPTTGATGVPAAANLASTGGGSSSTPMLLGGTALVLLGLGTVAAVRRRTTAVR
ncbi:hypothetical protein [Kitasatospora sp. NPDC090308]|uniref:hypothetical protein n=1 Tax=Kitasatospora sp. NPDC090308 TaxID=3364082 RepID=UPI00380C0021